MAFAGNHGIFILAILVVLSGCIGQNIEYPPELPWSQPPSESDALIIKSIQSIPDEIVPGQRAKILVYVENRIDNPIKNISAELFDYCQGTFTIVEEESQQHQTIDRLLGREVRELSWIIEAEEEIRLQNVCPADGVKVRVSYPFSTVSSATISFIDENEMQRLFEEGKFRNIPSNIQLGAGPVKPKLTVQDAQPVSTGSKTTVIGLQIENVGNGFLRDSKISKSQIKFESAGLPPVSAQLESCIGSLETDEIRLIQKKSPVLPCEISIPEDVKGKIASSDTIFVELRNYEYEIRKSVIIRVKPKF